MSIVSWLGEGKKSETFLDFSGVLFLGNEKAIFAEERSRGGNSKGLITSHPMFLFLTSSYLIFDAHFAFSC